MRVIYSIGVDFAGHGMGTIAYHAVRALHEGDVLKKLICASHRKSEIPEELICGVFPGGRFTGKAIIGVAKLLGSVNGYGLQGLIYDRLAARHIKECDIFHGWALHSVLSLAEANKKRVKVTVLERPNTHILYQKNILEEEYLIHGLKGKVIEDIEVERNLVEYESADYVIVASDFAYDSFRTQSFDMEKIIKLPYGYDDELFKPMPKPKDKFRVLFCGHISLRKGLPYLLKAWEKLDLKDAELVLVGKVFPEMKKILSGYKRKHGNITAKGFVPYKKIVDEYNKSSIFVFPSIEEGSALVNYEAMGCGLPVVTTPNSGSVVRDGVDGFIVPIRDSDVLAGKIQYLYDNRDEAERIGASAACRAKEFTWSEYGRKLISTYKKILEHKIK